MKVNSSGLFRKMLVTPRLNLRCDGVKLRLCYISNDNGNGWMIENFNNDGKTEWLKSKMTRDIVEMITEKYKEIDITWSRSW